MAESPKKKKKESVEPTVTIIDKNGNIIPDMSKVVVPEELTREILDRLNSGKKPEDMYDALW